MVYLVVILIIGILLLTFDPNDSQTLYYGTQKVYKTTNAAGNWTSISPDLSNGPHAGKS